MAVKTIETKDITIQKITYEKWKMFHESLVKYTDDMFTLDMSDKMSDVFIKIDWEKGIEMISPEPLLDGVFLENRLVGFIGYGSSNRSNQQVTIIHFILIHPKEQKKGIGKAVVRKVIEESKSPYIMMYPCTHPAKVICTQLGFKHDRDFCGNWDYQVYRK